MPDYTGKPVPANSTSRPAVVVVHGGGGTSGSRASTREQQISEFCASHGYVAFNIDYPLGAVYPKNIQSWRTAVRYLRANAATYGIDVNHIGITGGSFGGYCSGFMSGITNGQHTLEADSNAQYNNASLDLDSANELSTYSGNIQCAIDLYGPMNQVTSGNAAGQYSSPTTATLYNSSPVNYVHVGSAPILIAHGTADTTVSISNSYDMTNACARIGVPYQFCVIQGAQHTFYYYQTSGGSWPPGNSALDMRQTAFDWFDKWLLTANNPPSITAQPADATGCPGTPMTFSVAATGTTPFYYQWYGPSGLILGATSSSYTIASLTTGNAGGYSVTVSNAVGVATSRTAALSVPNLTAPVVTIQPTNQTAGLGSPVSLVSVATGSALQYQWMENNNVLPNATNATYSIASAGSSDGGVYQVAVYNGCGTALSSNATLTVNAPPYITAQPNTNDTVCSGETATFFASASGVGPLAYKWFGPSAQIVGAPTTNLLTLTNLTAADSGSYYLVVTNSYGAVTSSIIALTVSVNTDVTFLNQPTNTEVAAGGTATFSFTLTPGTGTGLTYQWFKGDYDPIPFAVSTTNATLVLTNVLAAYDQTFYHCLVQNSCSAVQSADVTLTVDSAPVITQQPQAQATVSGGSASFAVQVSGTAPLSYQWSGPSGLISGATNQTFTLSNVSTNNAGNYSVTITNQFGTVTSSNAALTVTAGSFYLAESFNYASGQQLANNSPWTSHNVPNTTGMAIVSGGLTYPGLADFSPAGNDLQITPISGQTNSYRPFDNKATNGTVYVSMLADCSAPVGSSGYYTFGLLPSSTTTPGGRTTDPVLLQVKTNTTGGYLMAVGTANAAAAVYATNILSLNTTNLIVLKYDMGSKIASLYLNPVVGSPEPGTPSATATGTIAFSDLNYVYFRGVAGSGTWTYDTIRIASTWNSVLPQGTPATTGPSVTQQPQPKAVTATTTANFSVGAAGTSPLFYQWRRGGVPISGATGSTYSLAGTAAGDSGSTFDVVITNYYGSITSQVATLTVNTVTTPTELLSIEAVKSVYYVQTSAAGPVSPATGGFSWAAEVQGILPALITSATVGFSGTNQPNPFVEPAIDNTDLAQNELFFDSKSALDAAFTNGNYHYVIQFTNGNTYTTDVPLPVTDNYPNAPTIIAPAADWSASGRLALHPVSGGYRLTWNSLSAPQDQQTLGITDPFGNLTEYTLPGSATNFLVPNSLVQPEMDYDVELTFTHMSYLSTNGAGTILYGLFESDTDFSVRTDPVQTNVLAASSWATVRDGANFNVDVDEIASGYVLAKYSTNGASGKGYFQFDLTGQIPDTNSPATFKFVTAATSGQQNLTLWALNQGYPNMNNHLIWATAQANDTNSENMLTSGALTATAITNVFLSGGPGTNQFTLPAAWGQFIQNNALILVFTTTAPGAQTNSSAGYRIAVNSAATVPTLTYSTIQPPVATTLAATGVTAGSATLNGTVNPSGAATAWYFQYGTTTNYGSVTATNNLTAGTTAVGVNSGLSGLSAGTVYHYQLVAANSGGSGSGGDATFSTRTVTAPQLVSPQVSASNGAQFSFAGTPGATFTILGSTNIALPLSSWTVLGVATENPAGQYNFADPQATNNLQRFYRVRSP